MARLLIILGWPRPVSWIRVVASDEKSGCRPSGEFEVVVDVLAHWWSRVG